MALADLIRKNPTYISAARYVDAMPTRDRQALLILGGALFLAIMYFMIWKPASDFASDGEQSYQQARELVSFIKANEATLQSLSANRASGEKPQLDSASLASTVSTSAGKFNIKLQRFEPSGSDKLRVWLENAGFNSMVLWLKELNENYGLVVSQISVDRSQEDGLVSVRLTLEN